MNAFARPVVIGDGAPPQVLDRVPLTAGELSFSEWSLQHTLFRFPECLPLKELDPHLDTLIPICTELETGAGPADILYVTQTGQVVLAETKLWRNPEARREVVAQILDYAKQLTGWNYDVLDEAASFAARRPRGHLLQCLRDRIKVPDEASFVDGIGRSLKDGDFLLLIIGDGIRYGAEALVTFLERYGHLRFKLSLIEVAAFRLPDQSLLLQPRILAKTEVLHKTVLLGPSGPVGLQEVAQADDQAASVNSQRTWFTEFWKAFLAKLELPDRSLMPTEPAKSTNQYFPMPPGGANAWISAYIAQSSGQAGVYLTFSKGYALGPRLYEELLSKRDQVEQDFGGPLSWEKNGDKVFVSSAVIKFRDLNDPIDRDRVTSYLAQQTSRLVAVLHPRLAAMIQSS